MTLTRLKFLRNFTLTKGLNSAILKEFRQRKKDFDRDYFYLERSKEIVREMYKD